MTPWLDGCLYSSAIILKSLKSQCPGVFTIEVEDFPELGAMPSWDVCLSSPAALLQSKNKIQTFLCSSCTIALSFDNFLRLLKHYSTE